MQVTIHAPALSLVVAATTFSCAPSPRDDQPEGSFQPTEVVDLGALVTADLPERLWGRAFLKQMGFTRPNEFEILPWTFPMGGQEVTGSNAYYTLFNHGGPHVDAPNHMGVGGGLDSLPVEAFSGPLKVFDASSYPLGRSVPVDVFEGSVEAGDVVVIFTRYVPPQSDDELPQVVTLTSEAAEYLARLPVRAYGTNSFSVESLQDLSWPSIHHSFLSRGIPVYEQLFNVESLLRHERMYFVGTPLNIVSGDGMIVRPVVLVH